MKKYLLFVIILSWLCIPLHVSAESNLSMINNINIVSSTYSDIKIYDEDNIIVVDNNKYYIGYISDNGLFLRDIQFDNIQYIGNNYYACYDKNGNVNIYDNACNHIKQLDNIYFTSTFVNDFIVYYDYSNHNAGVFNKNFDVIIDNIYDNVIINKYNKVFILKNDTWYSYDISTTLLTSTNYISMYVHENNQHIIANTGNEYHIISDNIFNTDSKDIIYVDMSYIILNDGDLNYLYRLFDNKITYKFNNTYNFCGISDESLLLESNSTYYYKDDYGNDILTLNKNIFMHAEPFFEGKAVVSIINSGVNYIDKNSNVLLKNSVDYCSSFGGDYAIIGKQHLSHDEIQWYIVDKELSEILIIDSYPININKINNIWYIKTRNNDNNLITLYYNARNNNTLSRHLLEFSNGVTNDGTITFVITYSTTYPLPECTFTREGYTFTHWTDGTNIYYPGDTFIMPDHDVTMTAVWSKNTPDTPNVPDKPNIPGYPYFPDIPIIPADKPDDTTPETPEYVCNYSDISGHWAEDYIKYIDELGLIDGITDTKFSPNEPMTREMFVIAMARLAGVEDDPINWAIDNEILLGYGNGNYGLDDTVNREQMAVFFMRYFDKMGINLDELKTIDYYAFADDEKISDWASYAVYEIQSIGLIQGKGDNIYDPQGTTSRAEAATVLYNLIQSVLNKAE